MDTNWVTISKDEQFSKEHLLFGNCKNILLGQDNLDSAWRIKHNSTKCERPKRGFQCLKFSTFSPGL